MRKVSQKLLLRLLASMLAFAMLLFAGNYSPNAKSYTYTVTISAGNQGSFTGTEDIQVDNSKTASEYEISLSSSRVRITGLQLGDVISCNAQSAVSVPDDSKYYVKGIRQSGRDNNTVADSAFTVKGDMDYVVAYGIPGDLTQYTVYFLDEEGNDLAEAREYYGNVGDKPVIAYLYIDGYIPATYNETKELVKDSSQNIFAFVYMKSTSGAGEDDPSGEENSESVSEEEGTEIVVIETEILEETEYVELEPDTEQGSAGAGDDSTEEENHTFNLVDDVLTPLGELVGDTLEKLYDDLLVPLGNLVGEMAADGTLIPASVGLVALIALIILLILFLVRRKKKEEDEEEVETPSGDEKETSPEDEKAGGAKSEIPPEEKSAGEAKSETPSEEKKSHS